ncbi:MAG: TetR/AcrR family transcriptional regulator [Thermoguttaceae bacterium]|nr:TetR/AcrR family transcriptional regulator [Thermoguttaceae bacterium]MBR4751987.1 TetR/AcrR family transcriptional regulator [Thermoguttaceae bacterium]MBR5760355.1 TetR/AcrR family transcriptional regulator [Thermoguttaceae bacterium]
MKKKTAQSNSSQTPEDFVDDASSGTKTESEMSVRERLILAALDEVEEVGFARFSLRRVASACGLSCAAPYKHFKNKRAIIEAILRHINSVWFRRQEIVLERLADEPLRVRLVELSLEFIRFMVENPQFRSILMIHDATFDSEYLDVKADLSAHSKKLIKKFCDETNMPLAEAKKKMYLVRSIIYGASLMFANYELKYCEETMEYVRLAIDREFDLPNLGAPVIETKMKK